jgi:hypothetical protein
LFDQQEQFPAFYKHVVLLAREHCRQPKVKVTTLKSQIQDGNSCTLYIASNDSFTVMVPFPVYVNVTSIFPVDHDLLYEGAFGEKE